MRATEYIDQKYVTTSPVTSLAKALDLRKQPVFARSTSWESFRDQWIKLMCSTWNARSRNLSGKTAEDTAYRARREFLEKQLKLALCRVERILEAEESEELRLKSAQHTSRITLSLQELQRKGRSSHHHMWMHRTKLLLQHDLVATEMQRFFKS